VLEVTTTAWVVTVGLVVALLAADLVLSTRRPHAVSFRAAVAQSVFYIGVAIAFGVVFGTIAGWDYGSQYFAGWVVEKSLSIDNLFVFAIIMTTFAVPAEHQHKVLSFGIIVALILRVIFIGIKLALHFGHLQDGAVPEIATSTSLIVIVIVLTITTIASLLTVRREPDARAHAGSLRSSSSRNRDPAGR